MNLDPPARLVAVLAARLSISNFIAAVLSRRAGTASNSGREVAAEEVADSDRAALTIEVASGGPRQCTAVSDASRTCDGAGRGEPDWRRRHPVQSAVVRSMISPT